MRIGFDARMITHPGIGRYIKCLVPEMVKQAPKDEFILFGAADKLKSFKESKNVRVVEWKAPIYSLQEQFSFPYEREDIDLVHIPHFNIPILCRKKMVTTIHDLIYLIFPEFVRSPLAKYYARFMIGSALKKTESVISVSNNTRKDLLGIFGKEYSEKIKTVYEAAGEQFHSIKNSKKIEDIQRKYSLSDKIILYVGSVRPHKNVENLVKAYSKLKESGISHQLVITGRWGRKDDCLKKIIDSDADIRYMGEIPVDDLVLLYNLADVLVHISRYEGFGLTVLEAMQCGTPVVTSDSSSLPEVAGKAALTVPCLNVGQIADTVYNVLSSEEQKKRMIEAGFSQAKQFSWEKAARETIEIYRNIT